MPPVYNNADEEELEKLDKQLIDLSSRAAIIRGSLDRLRKEQNDLGFDLRLDIVTTVERMTANLDRTQQAFQTQNITNIRRYMESLKSDVETLEQFIGRR